jgi:hypothetical protein
MATQTLSTFNSSRFNGDVRFGFATFRDTVEFSSAVFSNFSYFNDVKFGSLEKIKSVLIVHCQFEKPTTFYNATFYSTYPDFYGTILHDKTTFTDSPENWPQRKQSYPAQAKASCAVIRHNLGKQGLPEAEHFFFRREMGFAGQIGGLWQKLPYRVFGAVSDYGYSIERPLLWLGGLWVLGAFVFLMSFRSCYCVGDLQNAPLAASLSFSNIFNFFGFQRSYIAPEIIKGLGGWLHLFSAGQTIFGFTLLFFLGLGLRTRFRLR